MRPIWTGSISFGLVSIPVRMFSGTNPRQGIDLDMLHKADHAPIRYARICRKDGEEIPWDEIVKGYEYQEGDYIVYYLEVVKGGEKAYALLRAALEKSNKLALAKFVLHEHEHIAALKPVGRALVLNQMRYPSDLRQPGELHLPTDKELSAKEVDMALKLVKQETKAFIPEDLRDTYTDELEELIKEKAKGKGKKPRKADNHDKEPKGSAKNLMDALKASLKE